MNHLPRLISGTLLATGLLDVAAAQHAWIRIPTAIAPPNRSWGQSAFDASRNQLVVFGGVFQYQILQDTWEFDGRQWRERFPANAPSPRWAHRLAYDLARSRVVLFGGRNNSSVFGDTWEWDGQNWVEHFPATVPAPRAWHELVYHLLQGGVFLIGGSDPNVGLRSSSFLRWDGTDWTDLSPPFPAASPFPRSEAGAAYDLARDRLVVYGGWDGVTLLTDTWEWDGANWTLANPQGSGGPGQLSVPAMTNEPAFQGVVLHGGWRSTGYSNATWAWDGAAWTQRNVPNPLPLPTSLSPTLTMSPDTTRGRLLLTLDDSSGQLAIWVHGQSPYVEFGAGCAGASGIPQLAACPGSRPRLGTTFCVAVDNLPATNHAVFMAMAFQVATPWLDLGSIGMPGCFQLLPNGFAVQWVARSAPTQAVWNLPIPVSTAFLGVRFANQAIVYDPTAAGPVPLTVSNGGFGELGS